MNDRQAQELYDAVTQNVCESRADIVTVLGCSPAWVSILLREARSADFIDAHGWTIPHVGRGPGPHDYHVADGVTAQTTDELHEETQGVRGDFGYVATLLENGAGWLWLAAQSAPPGDGRLFRRWSRIMEGIGLQAREALERMP